VPPFKHDVFQNFKGYEYSYFMSDEWVYGGMWMKRFADWNLVLYLGVQGEMGSTYGPFLNVLAVDDDLVIKHRALQFSAKLDGKEYTFTLQHGGSIDFAPLGYNGREMVKGLSQAKDISFHITYEDFDLQLDQSQIGDISRLAAVSETLLSKNAWRYADWNWIEAGDIHSKITDNTVHAK
jgi:hypothetical protein